MSVEIKIPNLGESITEVTIATWLKKDGDYVEQDEIIAEVETDKASQDFPAEASGVLRIKAQEGDTVSVGDLIAVIEPSDKPSSSTPDEKEEPRKSSSPKATGEIVEMHVKELGESINEVTLSSWVKQDGDYVELDENIAEIESDKAGFDLPAEASGILRIVAREGEVISVGALICKIEVTDGPAASATSQKENVSDSQKEPTDSSYAEGHPSPSASKILAEKGLSPNEVKGTGVGGRITKEDALNAKKEKPAKPQAQKSAPQITNGGTREKRTEKMSSMRKTIARRLVAVKNETAMLTTFNEVDMKPVMDLRSKYKDKFKEKYEVGLGFMSFFTKAVCIALKEWPAVNAQINGDEIIYHDYCDISIAVSTPKGLVVPVIRNAEALRFDQIEKEVVRLATKGRDGKLSIDEMQGGTFSITNGGIFGSMLSTPIINPPQSAILGMHNIVQRPIALNGEVVIRPVMYLALSYDHRIVDGRESVSFLYRVKELLEDPGRLILEI